MQLQILIGAVVSVSTVCLAHVRAIV